MKAEKQTDTMYAVFFGLLFFGIMFFILTVHFWENIIVIIFNLDNSIAKLLNYYFNWFVGYNEIHSMVQFANIPKFNFWKLKFEYQISNDYINQIYMFYRPLHYTYTGIIIFSSYLVLNKFNFIPMFEFNISKNFKIKLIEDAKKRIKIKNRKMKLYNHQKLLETKIREPAKLSGESRFLNADYLTPFIQEDQIIQVQDMFNIDTYKTYINNSLYYSKHYINKFYYIYKNSDSNDFNIQKIKKILNFFIDLEKSILKDKNIKDIYYLNLLKYYDNKDKNKYISLYTFNSNSTEKFNLFINKYLIKNKIKLKILVNDKKNINNDIEYYTNMNVEKFNLLKELQTFVFIENDKIIMDLEELFILFKIMNYNFYEQKSYYFQSKEERIEIPLILFPSNLDKDISMVEKDELDSFQEIIKELEQYINKKDEFNIIKNKIDNYNNFIFLKENYINKIINITIPLLKKNINNYKINNKEIIYLLSNNNKEIYSIYNKIINNQISSDLNLFFINYKKFIEWLYNINIVDEEKNIETIIDIELLTDKGLINKEKKWFFNFKKYVDLININNDTYIIDIEKMNKKGLYEYNSLWTNKEKKYKEKISFNEIDNYVNFFRNIEYKKFYFDKIIIDKNTKNDNNFSEKDIYISEIIDDQEIRTYYYYIYKNELKISKIKWQPTNILKYDLLSYHKIPNKCFFEDNNLYIYIKQYIYLKKYIEDKSLIKDKNDNLFYMKQIEIINLPYKEINYIEKFQKLKEELINNYNNLIELKDNSFNQYKMDNLNEIEGKLISQMNKEIDTLVYKLLLKIEMYYKYNLNYNLENKDDVKPEIGQPVMPSTYILTPFIYEDINNNNNLFKLLKKFKVNGFKSYIYPVFEEIYNNWSTNIEDLISFYGKEIESLSDNLDIDIINKKERGLKLQLLKKEADLQHTNKSSIETKLEKIMKIHKFEETIIIAFWKELTKYENLPTTKLSNMKYENFILWYALTCIGDVIGDTKVDIKVIGRPFDFNAGLPIMLMYELEEQNYYDNKKNNKNIELNDDF